MSATSRVFALLGSFDENHRSLTITELAQRSGQALPTAHRLVRELVEWGGLYRQPSGRYVLGRRIWDMSLLTPVHAGLKQVASPFLQDLYAATLATVHLAERQGIEVLYLDRLSGRRTVPIVSRVGSRLPLHATAVGKVLLAHAPGDVQQEAMASLTRITAYTITRPSQLGEQLKRVRSEGFAWTSEEMSLGACSVAVPIRDATGQVTAALGVVVPHLRKERARLVAALQVSAQGISRSLSRNAELEIPADDDGVAAFSGQPYWDTSA